MNSNPSCRWITGAETCLCVRPMQRGGEHFETAPIYCKKNTKYYFCMWVILNKMFNTVYYFYDLYRLLYTLDKIQKCIYFQETNNIVLIWYFKKLLHIKISPDNSLIRLWHSSNTCCLHHCNIPLLFNLLYIHIWVFIDTFLSHNVSQDLTAVPQKPGEIKTRAENVVSFKFSPSALWWLVMVREELTLKTHHDILTVRCLFNEFCHAWHIKTL